MSKLITYLIFGAVSSLADLPADSIVASSIPDTGTIDSIAQSDSLKIKISIRQSILYIEPEDSLSVIAPGYANIPLTLEETIAEVIAHNPDIAAARLEWLANRYTADAAWGVLEPTFAAGYRHNNQQVNYSRFPFDTTRFNAGVEGTLLTGAKYAIQMTYAGSPESHSFYARPQAYSGASISQPLLKGTWTGSPLVQRQLSVFDREIALQSYRAKLIEILYQVENDYWTLGFAQERYRSVRVSVAIARKLVIDSKARLKAGKMSSLDVTEAEAGLATRLGEMEDARQGLLESISRLKMLLSSDRISKDAFITATSPLTIQPNEILQNSIVDSSTDSALSLQPEYLMKRNELHKAALELGSRFNRCLPQLDVSGSWGFVGNGTTSNQAFNDLFKSGQQSWSAEAQLKIELLGTESRNLYKAQKMRLMGIQKNLTAVSYVLQSTLRILVQRIGAQEERMANAQTVVNFRKRILEVEISRLAIGKSNYRLIYDAEEKLSQAQQDELESRTRCRVTLLEMTKASGRLLRDIGLESIEKNKPVLIDDLRKEE